MLPRRRIVSFLILALALAVGAPAAAEKRRAFATSVTGTGNLGNWPDAAGQSGLAAGDAICRARAAAAGLSNSSAYRAWLSTSSTDAYCHVQGLTGKRANNCNGAPQPGAGPWFLSFGTDGFTGSLAELTGAERTIYRPVTTDEFAIPIAAIEAGLWSGTSPLGVATAQTCADWTVADSTNGTIGTAVGTAAAWAGFWNVPCSGNRRLLCLEPGASETTRPAWAPGALAFVTSVAGSGDLSSWPAAGGTEGLEAGDQICRSLARAAHLPAPESFVAWLSDSSVDARDRITVDAAFRRVDGPPIAANRADLLDGAIGNSIHVDERGRYLSSFEHVWTGSDAHGVGSSNHCYDWSASDNAAQARVGYASLARSDDWTEAAYFGCATPRRLYCFSNVVTLFWDGFESTGGTARWSAATP